MKFNKWMWIVWPSFLVAGMLEVLVFGIVDPQDLVEASTNLSMSRQGFYTMGFFVFWVAAMLSSSLTLLLALEPPDREPAHPLTGTEPGG